MSREGEVSLFDHLRLSVGQRGSPRRLLNGPPRSNVIRCLRPNRDLDSLRREPDPNLKPMGLSPRPVF